MPSPRLQFSRAPNGTIVVGRGLIGNAIRKCPISKKGILILAAGRSNSTKASPAERIRERKLVNYCIRRGRTLIYFGSAEAYPLSNREYFRNKWRLEKEILKKSKRALVLRVPQVFGDGGNPNTIVNLFFENIKNRVPINIYPKMLRYLVLEKDLPKVINNHTWGNQKNHAKLLSHDYPLDPQTIAEILAEQIGIEPILNLIESPRKRNQKNWRQLSQMFSVAKHGFSRLQKGSV